MITTSIPLFLENILTPHIILKNTAFNYLAMNLLFLISFVFYRLFVYLLYNDDLFSTGRKM